MAGRPLAFLEEVRSPLARVHWLLRSHRLNYRDGRYETAAAYAPVLSQAVGRTVTDKRVHQYESVGPSAKPIPRDILRGYATTFGIDPDELCDFYVWISRNAGQPPFPALRAKASEDLKELAAQASYGARLNGRDWLRVADYCRVKGDAAPTNTMQQKLREQLAHQLAGASGQEARLLQEASARMGQEMSGPLHEAVQDNPARGYHAIEALSRLDAALALPVLNATLHDPADPWLVRSALEGLTDMFRHGGIAVRRYDGRDDYRMIEGIGKEFLQHSSHTVRQQAAQLLRVAMAEKDLARLLSLDDDVDVQDAAMRRHHPDRDLLVLQLRDALRQRPELTAAPKDTRLRDVIDDALFASSRTVRAEAGWLLRLSPYRAALSELLCRELESTAPSANGHDARPFAHERSMVRLVGALGVPEAQRTLVSVAKDTTRDHTIAVVAAWDLGGVIGDTGGDDLRAVYDLYPHDPEVRRSAINAAGRRGERGLLVHAEADADRFVRDEARAWQLILDS